MPRRDGMGPEGLGPKTGRGLGNCNLTVEKNIDNPTVENKKETPLKKPGLGLRIGLGRKNRRGR